MKADFTSVWTRPFLFACWLFALALLLETRCCAADTTYLRTITRGLAGPSFAGRGYVNDGMARAANFIAHEMSRLGLSVARQSFAYSVNSFPGKMRLKINGKLLRPGIDYLVQADSRSVTAKGTLVALDSTQFVHSPSGTVIHLTNEKLTWTVATAQMGRTAFWVNKQSIGTPLNFSAVVDADFLPTFEAQNILGMVRAAVPTDSFLVLTAHYDHLGMMGQGTVFAGANDNASGVALMLSLAKRYVVNPLKYNLLCIAFAGEEAGLLGSDFYVRHPTVQLANIRFLINLDLMGNGEAGITVVNATEHPSAFAMLQRLNSEYALLGAVHPRGKARNSDHYWFEEAGVPSFFIYTLGSRRAYHSVDDTHDTLPWFEGDDLEVLIYAFAARLAEGCCQ
jgi:aminopeptidase YwaD